MISKSLSSLAIEGTGGSEHDGGVEVSNDARHRAGGCDAGLGATIPGLQRGQHMGDLGEERHMVTLVSASWKGKVTSAREKGWRRGLGRREEDGKGSRAGEPVPSPRR